MASEILATKVYLPPPPPQAVLRPRLLELLNEGLKRKLVLLSAPAGFGKTTLVSEWIATLTPGPSRGGSRGGEASLSPSPFGRPVPRYEGGEGVRAAWLSLEADDSDHTRFLTYVITALQTVEADVGKGVMAALHSPQPPTAEAVLTALMNEIAAVNERFLLVLDDYHSIDSEQVDQCLAFLVEHLPPQLHLVIATREDPPLPLARLRARGQLIELRAADLRFTTTEVEEFLHQMHLDLSTPDITALEARTEGWITGLQLAALSMQGRDNVAAFIQAFTGSHRFVLDYLVEEVLQHQPGDVRSFLLQTCLLERLCAPLCEALTGREDGKQMLEALERGNLFLIPLDDHRHWYRYHHLFADVLQTHLLEALPDQSAELHRRASAWHEANGLRPEAIRHALAARDYPGAAGLIELAWPAAEAANIQNSKWLAWVKMLPEELVRLRPVLSAGYAYALLGIGEIEAAEQWLETAEALPGKLDFAASELVIVDDGQFQSLPAIIAIGRAYIAQSRGDIPLTVSYAKQALQLAPDARNFRHAQASLMLGMASWASGDLETANRVFTEYTAKLREAGNIPDAISTTVVLADIRVALGRLREATSTVEQLLGFVLEQGEPIPADTADLYRELSELYLEQGELHAAGSSLLKSKELGEKGELPVWRYRWLVTGARLSAAQGDLEGALALLDEAVQYYVRTPLPDFHPIASMKARVWAAQGKLAEAVEWVEQRGLSPDDPLSYLQEFEHLTLARIQIAAFQSEQKAGRYTHPGRTALRLLERLRQNAEEGRRTGSLIEILALQAVGLQVLGEVEAAIRSLQRALQLAEPQGYVQILASEGPSLGELVRKTYEDNATNIDKGYLSKLLLTFETGRVKSGSRNALQSNLVSENLISLPDRQAEISQPLIEPLSERELEVLKLLSSELNGPEIARELMVSLSTVRTHTQHIYAKLGVSSRRAAVRRAAEIQLL